MEYKCMICKKVTNDRKKMLAMVATKDGKEIKGYIHKRCHPDSLDNYVGNIIDKFIKG